MESRKHILDLKDVIRIDVEPLKDGIVKLPITKAEWGEDRDGSFSLFIPKLLVDRVEVYGDKNKLLRLLHKIIEMLGEDAVNELKELLEESGTRDEKDKYINIMFQYTPRLFNSQIEDDDMI